MGRHSSSRAGAVTAMVVAGVILLVGGGAWAVGSMLQEDGGPTAGATTTSQPTATASATRPSSPPPDLSASASPSASASVSASAAEAETARAAAHAACVAQVAAGERVAKASASSALHWRQHTQAQLDHSAGKISLAQRTKAYADSKAFGAADATEFAAAVKALGATGSACARAGGAADATTATKACQQRMAALSAVHRAGTTVQNQWAEHMAMMAHKAHADLGAYHQRWLTMVADAQPTLRAHDAAAAALGKAPACA